MVKISKLYLTFFCVSFCCVINVVFSSKNSINAPVKLKNLICNWNSTWFNNVTCKIKAHSRVKRTAEMQGYLMQRLDDLTMTVTVFKRYSGWKPWVIPNLNFNFCDIMAGKNHPIVNIVKKMVVEHTSLNHTCPYFPGLLVVTNFDLNDLALGTLIIPKGEYRVDISITRTSKIRLALVNFVVEVWEKR